MTTNPTYLYSKALIGILHLESIMSRQNENLMLASIIGAVLIAGIAFVPLMIAQVNADKTVINNCKIDKQTGTCEFDQTYKSKRGDIKVQNKIDASAIANGGNGNNGPVVDEQARNDISDLKQKDINQDTASDKLAADIANVNHTVSQNWNMTDQRLGQLADASNAQQGINENNTKLFDNLTATIAQLKTELADAITDIEGGNQSSGGGETPPVVNNTGNQTGNQSSGGGGEIPPVTNETGNQTGNQSGGGGEVPPVTNETGNQTGNQSGGGGEVPPVVTNETGNATGSGNATQPSGNVTGNVTNSTGGTPNGTIPALLAGLKQYFNLS